MPRFFFHITDGHSEPDDEGTELPDIYTAQDQAVRMSGEILRNMGAKFLNGSDWKLEIADECGEALFILHFSHEEKFKEKGA